MEIQDLINLNFDGPYPHGEYYLFDEEFARQDNGWCCIMCVYPDYYSDGSHMLHYNSERCLWSNPESNFFRSGEIKFNSLEELMHHIEKSKCI